jgi:hypothetical protein
LGVFAKEVAVKGAGGEGEAAGLGAKGRDDPGMAMTLIDGRVPAQEVIVSMAVHVPDMNTQSPVEDDGKGMIVMGSVSFFEFQVTERFGRELCRYLHKKRK